MKKSLLLAMCIMLGGCAHVGEPLDPQAVSQVVEGKTTRAELINLLGQPIAVTRESSGIEVLTWTHVVVSGFGGYRQQSLSAWLSDGVVSRYTLSNYGPQ